MDKSKAKKAVKKSTSHKKKSAEKKPAEAALPMQPIGAAMINPEIQKGLLADLQPVDGLLNPYRPLGSVAPTLYTPGNLLPGYNAPQFVNPET